MFCLKVFNFEGTLKAEKEDNRTFATLSNPVEQYLEKRVFLCFSFSSGKLDGFVPVQILDENGENWLFFMGADMLSAIVGPAGANVWYEIGKIDARPMQWNHVCLDLDPERQTINVAINGNVTAELEGVSSIAQTKPGKITIGKTDDFQFHWMVTNLHLFSPTPSLAELSKTLCRSQGDLLPWHLMIWQEKGDWYLVKEQKLEEGRVCTNRTTYDIPLKIYVEQEEGLELCQKLGQGVMSPPVGDAQEMEEFLDWFQENTAEGDDFCYNIWTPLSDEKEEGVWRSLVDGVREDFLPCAQNFCDKPKRESNAMAIYLPDRPLVYYDTSAAGSFCLSCTLNTSLVFRLKGLCLASILGESMFYRNYF